MGMLDRFTPRPEEVTIDEPETPDPRSLLVTYMIRDGYTGEEVEQYMAAQWPEPVAETVAVDLTPFRDVHAVCVERMRHFGGGVGQTYQQVASLLETAIQQSEAQ